MTFTPEWVAQQNAKRSKGFYNLAKTPGPGLKKLMENLPRPTEPTRPFTFSDLEKACVDLEKNESQFFISMIGRIRGGKNSIIVTRTGKRIPEPKWAMWRDKMVAAVRLQIPPEFTTIDVPTNIRLTYWAGDRCRRDMPAIVDAIFHVLEKAGVVKDDCLLWVSQSSRHYDKQNPGALIEFL